VIFNSLNITHKHSAMQERPRHGAVVRAPSSQHSALSVKPVCYTQ